MLLTDQRITTSHGTLNAILNIKINDKVFTESEKNEILFAAVKSFMEKCKEAVFEENTTVSQTLEEDRMTCEDQVRMNETNMYMKTLHKRSVAVMLMMKPLIDGIMNMMMILLFIMMMNESCNHFDSDKMRVSICLIAIPS